MSNPTVSWTQASTIFQKIEKEEQQLKIEMKQALSDAKEDVLSRIYDNNDPFSYDDIEDIMHGHGLEMDYLLDFLC